MPVQNKPPLNEANLNTFSEKLISVKPQRDHHAFCNAIKIIESKRYVTQSCLRLEYQDFHGNVIANSRRLALHSEIFQHDKLILYYFLANA